MKATWAIAACLVGTGALGAGDPQDPRLAKVLADWQNRQSWFRTIEYEVTGEHKILRGAYSDAFPGAAAGLTGLPPGQVVPPQDVGGPVRLMLLLDFATGRHRHESTEQVLQSTGQMKPQVKRDVFDGVAFTGLVEMPVPQIVTVLTGSMNGAPFPNETHPIFFGHGRILTLHQPILPGLLRNQPDAKYLLVHGNDMLNGRQCLVVRTQTLVMATTSFQEFWVDPDHDSAIVRYRSFSGDNPTSDLVIDYGPTDGRWLPQAWHLTTLRQGKTLQREDLRVARMNVNQAVAAADFRLPAFVSGTIVRERFDEAPSNGKPAGMVNPRPAGTVWTYEIQPDGSRKLVPDPFRSPNDQFRRGAGGGG